jgi:transcriptional regulator GlxA family with amidase domain
MLYGLKETLGEQIPRHNVLSLTDEDPLKALFEGCMSCSGEHRRTLRAGYANLLIAGVLSRLPLQNRIKSDNSSLVSILDYCAAHFEEPLTLSDLADALHLSRYHISHLLNAKLGLGLNAYLNILRVKRACELLQEGDKKIAEVSLTVGFGSIRSFNRAFISVMDMTPQEYRNLSHGGKDE